MATTKPAVKKTAPLHKRLQKKITELGLSKRKIAKHLKMARPTFSKYLKNGVICNVGHREEHDISAAQKKIIRETYLRK